VIAQRRNREKPREITSLLLVIAGEFQYLASCADSVGSYATASFSTLAVLSRVCNVPLSHKAPATALPRQ
jgi:hypothetical protein